MLIRCASAVAFVSSALFAQHLFAQQSGGPSLNTGGISQPTSDISPIPSMSDIQRPVFLSGRVMLEDGSPPPERVTIERACTGSPIPEGYTDSKGNFSFELGRRFGVQIDASTNMANDVPNSQRRSGTSPTASSISTGPQQGGFSERDLMSCEIRANLPGYTSTPVVLAGRRVLDKPDIGTIILHPVQGVTGYTFSATTGLATKEARKAFEKGTEQLDKRKFAAAQKELEKAVAASPKFAAAWSSLGLARLGQDDTPGALEAFAKAAESDERFVTPHLQLMSIYGQKAEWPGAARESQRVIELNPIQFPQAYFYNAAAHLNLKNYDQAEKSAREAIRLDEQHRYPRAEFLLGLLTAQKGNFAESAQLLRSYAGRVQGADLEAANKQLAEVERRLAAAGATAPAPAN
jgi:tetratricopeptide (TPR) repeat protein